MKKWTYLVAAGMLLGAAPVFTGCIDNDEPEGITILRGAKAELLKAKAAVEAAKVAQVQAEAALLQAQAKYQEALAVTEAANAKIQEAIAKQEEAKAALLETQNEQAKQELQAAIAELEHQKEMWEIEKNNALTAAEQAAKMWELSYKQAEVAYEEALVSLEKQKTALTQQQLDVLNPYITALKEAKDAYAQKVEKVRKAQRKVDEAKDIVDETVEDKEYWQYWLARELKLENYKLEGIKAAKTNAEKELVDMQNTTPTPMSEKKEALEKELNELTKEIADASVKAAEERRAIQEGELTEYNNKVKALNESMQEDIEIPAFTYPEVVGEALPFAWADLKDVEYEALTYKWNDVDYEYNNYNKRLNELTTLLERFTSWTRDENDNEWTLQHIAEWEQAIKDKNAEIEQLKTDWRAAVDAYHRTPADVVIDLSKIEGYTEAYAAITPFNNAVKEYQKAVNEFHNLYNGLYNIRNEASATERNSRNEYSNEYNKLDEKTVAERERLYQNYQDVIADPEATEEEKQEAEDAYLNFDYWDYFNKLDAELIKNRDQKISEARATVTQAVADVKTAAETYKTKRAALDTEESKVTPLYDTYYENATRIDEESMYGTLPYTSFYNAAGMEYQYYEEASYYIGGWIDENGIYQYGSYIYLPKNFYTYEINADAVTEISRSSLVNLLNYRSQALFGLGFDKNELEFDKNEYGDYEGRLLDLTYDDIKKMIEESSDEPLYGDAYLNECYKYGKMGEVFALEAQIDFAKAWLSEDNDTSVKSLINTTSQAIDAMKNTFETLQDNYNEQWEALDQELKAINQKLQDAVEALNELRATRGPIIELKNAVISAISDYESAGYKEWTQESIDQQIELLNAKIRGLQLAIEDQEHNIETAQRNLDGYNSEQLTALQTAQNTLEDAEAQMKIAEKTYNDALDLLKKIINKMSLEVSDDTTTTEPAE